MVGTDPAEEYRAAARRLLDLADDVALERSHQEVIEALTDVQAAVARIYPGRGRGADGAGGARPRILAHFQKHLGDWVSSDEIAAVSRIGEWARRIRELRLEQGYEIEEGGGRYRLLITEPNEARRERWRMVTRFRNQDGEPAEKLLALFEELVGQVLTIEELNRVARSKDGARLARQLRITELLPIETSADAPDLRAGDHRLVSAAERYRLHPSQSLFSEDLRRQVFGRDRFICKSCRTSRGGRDDDRPTDVLYLVVRHLDASPDSVAELPVERLHDLSRLATLCNRCATGD